MPAWIVALLTDFGHRDPFVGMMKGVMLGINPDLQLIDISHDITPQGIREAAIVLSATYPYFPLHTIFLVVVDPGVGGTRRPIVVETAAHLFVGPDNGVLGPVLDQAEVRRVIHVTEARYFRQPISRTFHGRDIFAPVAAWLSRGAKAHEMGPAIDNYRRLELPRPYVGEDGCLEGEVLYRDRFGNLMTNISEAWVTGLWGPPPWPGIWVYIETAVIRGLDSYYAQRSPQELGFIINSWGRFEVFVNEGSAARATGAVEGSSVRICRGETLQQRA
jgi:S-adenosyl-L-methionine hydrolase (adenosine-forming)